MPTFWPLWQHFFQFCLHFVNLCQHFYVKSTSWDNMDSYLTIFQIQKSWNQIKHIRSARKFFLGPPLYDFFKKLFSYEEWGTWNITTEEFEYTNHFYRVWVYKVRITPPSGRSRSSQWRVTFEFQLWMHFSRRFWRIASFGWI